MNQTGQISIGNDWSLLLNSIRWNILSKLQIEWIWKKIYWFFDCLLPPEVNDIALLRTMRSLYRKVSIIDAKLAVLLSLENRFCNVRKWLARMTIGIKVLSHDLYWAEEGGEKRGCRFESATKIRLKLIAFWVAMVNQKCLCVRRISLVRSQHKID